MKVAVTQGDKTMSTKAKVEELKFDGTFIQDDTVSKYMREGKGMSDSEIKAEAIRTYNSEAMTELAKNCGLNYGQEKRLAYKFIRQFLEDRLVQTSMLSCSNNKQAKQVGKIMENVINNMVKDLDERGFLLEETDITAEYEGGLKHILYC